MAEITKDTIVAKMVGEYPKTADVMAEYGLHCFGCHFGFHESIEGGAKGHGMDNETIEKLLKDLNSFVEEEYSK